MLKHCRQCDTTQPVDNFYHNKSIACGRHASCRSCCRAKQKVVHAHKREKAKIDRLDEVDFARIISFLKSARVPTSGRIKAELIDLWNESTNWYVPRMSDKGKELKTMELTE